MFLNLIYFGGLFWFGLYILNRDAGNKRLLLTGLGLLVYSCGLGAALLLPYAQAQGLHTGMALLKVRDISFYLPLVFWQGAILSDASEHESKRNSWWIFWKYGLLVLVLVSSIYLVFITDSNVYSISYIAEICTVLFLFVFLSLGRDIYSRSIGMGTGRVFVYLPLLVYACFTILILTLQDHSWITWGLIANSIGLLVFAVHTMITEIKKQGETWLPDFFRSLDYSVFFTLLFSGQVALVIVWGTGFHFLTVLLLMISIAVSIAFQVFVDQVRAMLDHIAFMTFPKLRQERSRLRLVERVQVRLDDQAAPEEMEEDELYRLTRRALSHFGDLQRLATSPLTQLKLIDRRLRDRGAADEVLERAAELKLVLMESIAQLKPRRDEDFGTADEWRYYNVLYFPYIVGIKPYSMRYSEDQLDTPSREALAWFRTYVPERTFYNWQNAGAKLIAVSLREKNTNFGH